jgi:hypothetical protein
MRTALQWHPLLSETRNIRAPSPSLVFVHDEASRAAGVALRLTD